MKIKSFAGLAVCTIIIGLLAALALNGMYLTLPLSQTRLYFPGVLDEEHGVKRGLDLVGGSIITYEADVPGIPSEADMRVAETIIRSRLDFKGYFDASVSRQGAKSITIEIPAISNPEEAVQTLGQTAQLSFATADGETIMTGKEGVNKAEYVYGRIQENGEMVHHVSLELTPLGQTQFAEATDKASKETEGNNVIAIKLDDTEISRPRVSERIDSPNCVISGSFNKESAEALANQIASGQLPFSLKETELRTVGATLGDKALDTSLVAAGIGVLLVLIYMLVVYRLPGLVANIALCGYISLVSLVMAGYFLPGDFRATLTLPGVAGIILSIGMAVDANVIIFERLKEELRTGKTVRAALEAGFDRALTAIIDSNVTTIIAAGVLWSFGTGPIKGFALTLFIGIVLSMFTAVFVTRWLLRFMVGLNIKNPILYGFPIGKKEAGSSN